MLDCKHLRHELDVKDNLFIYLALTGSTYLPKGAEHMKPCSEDSSNIKTNIILHNLANKIGK